MIGATTIFDRTVLFHRDFRGFSGGHLKVWHYFRHFESVPGFRPRIYFTPESVWDNDNPWASAREHVVDSWKPAEADILFLAGLDWYALDAFPGIEDHVPVLNLVQHVRHGDPADERYKFLPKRATRICVSNEVARAVNETGRCNGPVHTIPNAVYLNELPTPAPPEGRKVAVFIDGLKNPTMAMRVHDRLKTRGVTLEASVSRLPRSIYLEKLSTAKVAILLPSVREGLFLPPLEAMALECLVVSPSCPGNRMICQDGVNCISPEYEERSLLAAAERALALSEAERAAMLFGARATVARHRPDRERSSFLNVVRSLVY